MVASGMQPRLSLIILSFVVIAMMVAATASSHNSLMNQVTGILVPLGSVLLITIYRSKNKSSVLIN